jgi:hypothetical protein
MARKLLMLQPRALYHLPNRIARLIVTILKTSGKIKNLHEPYTRG